MSGLGKTKGTDKTKTRAPGFILYAVGIFVWMTFVSCCGATYALPFTPPQVESTPYVLSQQAAYVLTFFVVAALAAKRRTYDTSFLNKLWRLMVASFVVFLACLGFFEFNVQSSWLVALYGVTLGVGMTLGYTQWTALVSQRPHREIVQLVLIASLASIASGAVLCLVPSSIRIVLAGCVLMPASVALQRVYFLRYGSGSPAGLYARPDGAPNPTPGSAEDSKRSSKLALSRLIPSIVCAVVLALVAPIVSTIYMESVSSELARSFIAQGANLFAVAVLALLMLPVERRVTLPNAYRALLPILASAVLIGAFFEPAQRGFVLFFSEACFCVVSLLMLIESCAISRESGASPLFVYGIIGGFVYLARTPEALFSLNPSVLVESASPIVTALLLYLLTIPSFALPLLSRGQGRGEDKKTASPQDVPQNMERSGTDAVCERLAKTHGLTQRQASVMNLLVKGVSTQRIAETLSLSENTVATYRRAIYAALEVHARQELLDLVEAESKRSDPASD